MRLFAFGIWMGGSTEGWQLGWSVIRLVWIVGLAWLGLAGKKQMDLLSSGCILFLIFQLFFNRGSNIGKYLLMMIYFTSFYSLATCNGGSDIYIHPVGLYPSH